MKRRLARYLVGLCLVAGALAGHGCSNADPGSGSNTNWLRLCASEADCADGLSCFCGVCTETCESTCHDLPHAVCARAGSSARREQCQRDDAPASGLCLPACGTDVACDAGQFCSDGGCLQIATTSASSCVAGAKLELTTAVDQLKARYGSLFADALYLPVNYDAKPADWIEPIAPAPITARVTDAEGKPVSGCAVRFITADGSGAAFADAPETDKMGEVSAYWVAGEQRRQLLSAVLADAAGEVVSSNISGTAYADDEGPQADAARIATTRPTTLRLAYDLPDTSDRVRVVLSAASYPHHAFYAALNIDGFFAGLQNTSDLDAQADDVPEADRVLIASVWNLPEGDAQQLFSIDAASCAPHDQDLGGIRCLLPGAWEPGKDYLLELERTTLATGESGPGYAALGYSTEPCSSAAGCTDYTLFFGSASDPSALSRVVAYRYQSGVRASGFGSFLQPYADLPTQNSCLSTPVYDVRFLPLVERDGNFEPVPSARFDADYQSWHNEICANYSASSTADGYRLMTGGPRLLDRPKLPDEPSRALLLP